MMSERLCLLGAEQRRAVADAAFRLLAEVGVRLTEPVARELLRAAGARLAGERAYIPAELVAAALATAPSGVEIYDRNGAPAMRLAGACSYFGAHVDAPDVIDPADGVRRPCLAEDVRRHARLIESLPNISFATASGLIADVEADLADQAALRICLENTRKPVLAMPVTLEALEASRAMAAAAVGGDDALRSRPTLIVYAEPVSPLSHPDESIRKLLYCAEHALPVAYVPFAAMGGTAPQGRLAILVQLCAESLSALVIHQLHRPRAPFVFGGMSSVMDMRTTVFSYGAPEFQAGNTMMAEMAHHFNLPNFGTAGTSDAQVFDGQAILEATSSCTLAMLSGAQLVHDVGLLGSATVVVPEMIVATDEIVAMLRHALADLPAGTGQLGNDEQLTNELFAGVDQRGEYVTQPYTLAHYREAFYPRLLYRGGAKAWRTESPTFEARVRTRTLQLMADRSA